MCIFLFEKCRNMFSSCHQLQQAPGRLDPGAFHLLPSPARKFPQKTLTNPCPSGNIYRQSVRLRIEYGRVPEWPMGTDCKSAAFSFGGSNPPAPTKKTSVENTLVFCFIRYLKFHSQGWIRTASARRTVRRANSPCGAFLDARLAISTRAHQKTSTYESTLRFLFCYKARLTGQVDPNNSGADRCLRQKQGGEAGAALRVPFYFTRLAKFMKNAQTKTTVRVDGGSVIA